MFRHASLALLLALGAPALAARPPASENQRVDQDRRMMDEGETYGVVTQIDRQMHTLTVRKLSGEIVTYDFGTMNLPQDVNVGSTVRLKHEQDSTRVSDVNPITLMHDVGVVTKIDEEKNTISIRQLGGEVVEYDFGDRAIDPTRIRVGERVDIAHESGTKDAIFVDLADRSLEDLPEGRSPEEQPVEPTIPPEG